MPKLPTLLLLAVMAAVLIGSSPSFARTIFFSGTLSGPSEVENATGNPTATPLPNLPFSEGAPFVGALIYDEDSGITLTLPWVQLYGNAVELLQFTIIVTDGSALEFRATDADFGYWPFDVGGEFEAASGTFDAPSFDDFSLYGMGPDFGDELAFFPSPNLPFLEPSAFPADTLYIGFSNPAGDEFSFNSAFTFEAVAAVAPASRSIGLDGNNIPDTTGYGSVPYEYALTRFEITNREYATFLNHVARSDPFTLYDPNMASDPAAGGIVQSGIDGAYVYSTVPGFDNKPVAYVSYWDALRFANWTENGQPYGASSSITTENGAYPLTGADETSTSAGPRNPGIAWWLPNENEWYKAAYYDDGLYRDYPNGSSSPMTCGAPSSPGFNLANCDLVLGGTSQIGSYPNSENPFRLLDMGGNISEWVESVPGPQAVRRGGSWSDDSTAMSSVSRLLAAPLAADSTSGFRLARSALILGTSTLPYPPELGFCRYSDGITSGQPCDSLSDCDAGTCSTTQLSCHNTLDCTLLCYGNPTLTCSFDSECDGVCSSGFCSGGSYDGQACTLTAQCEDYCESGSSFCSTHIYSCGFPFQAPDLPTYSWIYCDDCGYTESSYSNVSALTANHFDPTGQSLGNCVFENVDSDTIGVSYDVFDLTGGIECCVWDSEGTFRGSDTGIEIFQWGTEATTTLDNPDGDILPTQCQDNCPNLANDDQIDTDEDGIGDACDSTPLPEPGFPTGVSAAILLSALAAEPRRRARRLMHRSEDQHLN